MAGFWLLPALLLVGWFWLDSMRAHEHATRIARRACQRHDRLLLDETVALKKLRLGRSARGLRWRRTYGFQFTADGDDRSDGEIELLGLQQERLWMELGEYLLHDVDGEQADDDTPPPTLH